MFSPLKVANQGRQSMSPLKVDTKGCHNIWKRLQDKQVVALYSKNNHQLKKKNWDPLRDLRVKYGLFSPLKVAIHGRISLSPRSVATKGCQTLWKRLLDIQYVQLYVKHYHKS